MDNGFFNHLTVPLPEDVEKLKWRGEFAQAARVIDLKLQKDIPQALKRRLMLEKEILSRLPSQYPYTWEQALDILRENVRDFKDQELRMLWEEDGADWIYVNGQVRFRSSFLKNVLKTRLDWEMRALKEEMVRSKAENFALLDKTVGEMKEKGKLAYSFRVSARMRIKETAERDGERVKIYLPLPIEYAQIQNVTICSVKIGDREADREEYTIAPIRAPQRTVCFHTIHRPGQTYQVEFVFENHSVYRDLHSPDAALLAKEAGLLSAGRREVAEQDLAEQLPHIRFTPYIRELVSEITGEETNPLLKAWNIYRYITTHVMYSYMRSYFTLTDIVQYAASSLKGDCGVQALLFITLCRAANIPARWQAGLYTTPLEISCHDWAQFYVEPFGWLYADCSYGGAAYREGHEKRWRFYFGNLDPFRLPAAREFGSPFIPPMSHLRNDPYDNQTGEAEYGDRSLLEEEYETVFEMKDMDLLP